MWFWTLNNYTHTIMEITKPLFHEVFVSFFFQKNLIETLFIWPDASPIEESLRLWMFSSLNWTTRICMKRSSFWIWWYMSLLHFSVSIETVFGIGFFHGFWFLELIFVDIWNFLMTSKVTYHWFFLLRLYFWNW